MGFVNARGPVLAIHLRDIPNRIREVALHGVRHGAATALATAQARSSHNLQLLPHGFPDAVPVAEPPKESGPCAPIVVLTDLG